MAGAPTTTPPKERHDRGYLEPHDRHLHQHEGNPTNSALIGGAEDLVLIDTGRTLREIHMTHARPDHYVGIAAMGEAFPDVEVYAHPGTVDAVPART